MKQEKLAKLSLLIEFLQELAHDTNGKYTEEEKQKFTEATIYLKQFAETKDSNTLLKGIGSFVRAYILHELFDDD